MNPQLGSDDTGGAIGVAFLALLILVVPVVSTSPNWLAGNVRTTYAQCMAAAQTPADQRLCDPSAGQLSRVVDRPVMVTWRSSGLRARP
jgi:hypothetical protein